MHQLNQSTKPTVAPTPVVQGKNGRPILHVSKPRGPSAQATSFLRRRKVVKILAAQTDGTYIHPEVSTELQVYADYPITPILDVVGVEDFHGENEGFYPHVNSHQHRMGSAEHDECLTQEYWTIQGAVNGNFMNELPMNNRTLVHSMDM